MELITTHTHTNFTNHGEGSVEQLVCAAKAAGITTLAITEHFPLSKAMDPEQYLSMRTENMPHYLAEIKQAQKKHPDVEKLFGSEQDCFLVIVDRV